MLSTLLMLSLTPAVLHMNMQDATFRVGQTIEVCWDTTQQDIDNGQLTRSEGRMDNGAWVNVGAPIVGNCTSRWTLPTLAAGPHTAQVRWCNQFECGAAASVVFTVIPLAPGVPRNLRPVPPTPTPVNLDEAIEIAQSYAYLYRLSRLNPSELTGLALTYKGPLEKSAIMTFLDAEAARLMH